MITPWKYSRHISKRHQLLMSTSELTICTFSKVCVVCVCALTVWSVSGGRTMVFSMVFITSFHSSFSTRFSTVFSQILANKDKLAGEWNRRKARWITQQEEGGSSFLKQRTHKPDSSCAVFIKSLLAWMSFWSLHDWGYIMILKPSTDKKVALRISPKATLHKDDFSTLSICGL